MERLLASSTPSRPRIVAVGLLSPAAAVAFALALGTEHLATAPALCLLAVVAAAAVGGRGAGLIASAVSFLGLNYFFTEPRHTLAVHQASDLIALFAFLLTAIIVGTLLSRALEERARAERRATEAQFLSRTTERLGSREPVESVLVDLAASLVELFGLRRCEIATPRGSGSAGAESGADDASTITMPLTTPSGSVGTLTLVGTDRALSVAAADLLRTLAAQTALAIERSNLDEQVRAARLEAEASTLRAALFSSVTHDLRTPLSSIKASVSGLLGEGAHYDVTQIDEMLRTVLEETDHLNQIVTNLLDLARMRSGALVPSAQPVLIEDVVGAVLRRMRRRLETVPVRTSFRPELPAVLADPTQLQQVLSNLIENAARFSPGERGIEIAAARWRDSVQVRVIDHGPGIPREDRERVFDEFYRKDVGEGRGGTGLGLAIAKAVIVAHGGAIRAEGVPGGGTAIVFELPIADQPVPPSVPDPASGLLRR